MFNALLDYIARKFVLAKTFHTLEDDVKYLLLSGTVVFGHDSLNDVNAIVIRELLKTALDDPAGIGLDNRRHYLTSEGLEAKARVTGEHRLMAFWVT
ncbi:hypothetical protein LTR56_024717 [Elasticomyces elasticus]|nr:hypothetical protein LTR56_024717 [Elasticomyces elasticus]KAK3619171.1 hypothetical protein LTR22_026083 [Elasticomyces elasticus]KAK4903830.1 hypothetical protein LTR49_026610 [Elasticomyces elasticus]KAK5720416.1 hypothetical protein LTS12_027639 [Elasticomyces elasticus]